MSNPGAVAMGACLLCGDVFTFDPFRVVTIPIDPTNGLPPDQGGDPARAVKREVCPTCVRDKLNPVRRERGLPLVSEEDTAANPGRTAQEWLGG